MLIFASIINIIYGRAYIYSSNNGFSEKCVGHLMFLKWRQNPRWPSFVREQRINWNNFAQNRSRFVILASNIGFSGMSDIVVWLESTIYRHCIVGKILNCQGQTKTLFHFGRIQTYSLFYLKGPSSNLGHIAQTQGLSLPRLYLMSYLYIKCLKSGYIAKTYHKLTHNNEYSLL